MAAPIENQSSGGKGKIHLHPNSSKGNFSVNKHNINTTGLNRKSFTSFNLKCKQNGIEEVTRNAYYSTVGNLMNLTELELQNISNDKDEVQWIRWLIQDLQNKDIRSKIMADYRDWLFGKAQQAIDHTTKGEKIESKQNVIITDPETAKEYQKILDRFNDEADTDV